MAVKIISNQERGHGSQLDEAPTEMGNLSGRGVSKRASGSTRPIEIPAPTQYECSHTFQIMKRGLSQSKFLPLLQWRESCAGFLCRIRDSNIADRAINRQVFKSLLDKFFQDVAMMMDHLGEEEGDITFFKEFVDNLEKITSRLKNPIVFRGMKEITKFQEVLELGKRVARKVFDKERVIVMATPASSAQREERAVDDLDFNDLF